MFCSFAGCIALPFQILADVYIQYHCQFRPSLHFSLLPTYHIIQKGHSKNSTTPPLPYKLSKVCVCFLLVYVLNPAPCLRSNLPRNRDVLVGWQDLLNEIASSSRRLRAARGGAQDAAGGAAAVTGPGPGRSRSPESRPRPGGCWGWSLPRGGGRLRYVILGGGDLKYFVYVSSLKFGEDEPILTSIFFQRGLVQPPTR